jgi:deferrochelatase/peroxidase EfeB
VIGFWTFVRKQASAVDEHELVRRAAKLIGRWPSGTPVVTNPTRDPKPNRRNTENDFAFRGEDPDGHACPYGSHIRRANPRDDLVGESVLASLAETRKHRLLRRGRPYGVPVRAWLEPRKLLELARFSAEDPRPRGLLFMAVVADIERQFEFVHRRWFNDPLFVRSGSNEVDPVVGDQSHSDGTFTAPHAELRTRFGAWRPSLQGYVQVRGGEYFFLPSRPAMRYLGMMPPS